MPLHGYSLGIDLTSSSKRPSAYALVNSGAELAELGRFKTTEEIVDFVKRVEPELIAIDAPLTLPLGLDCLEEDHDCIQKLDLKGRTAEQELAAMHIGCFFTTKRSIIKTMIYRAVELYKDLSTQGFNVVEVYPYATKVLLLGANIPPKNSVRGLQFLKEHTGKLISGLEQYEAGLDHNACDALLAAYTGSLHLDDRTDLLGLPEEGHIVVPKLVKTGGSNGGRPYT